MKILINIVSAILTLAFRAGRRRKLKYGMQKYVIFITRQSSQAPRDYELLEHYFINQGFRTRIFAEPFEIRHPIHAVATLIAQSYNLGLCDICFVNRFAPAVSLLRFPKDGLETIPETHSVWNEFPTHPVVIQIWHAFGAFKKFGFQSLDTPEGRSANDVKNFHIHRNYSWIMCSGERNRELWAQALGYPKDRVLALGRPLFDDLIQAKTDQDNHTDTGVIRILIAPTLRRDPHSPHPFKDLYMRKGEILASLDAGNASVEILWRFHPSDPQAKQLTNAHTHIETSDVDIVITDYSSIFYEAALLKKKVLFYVPDLDVFEQSPGINIDLRKDAPHLICTAQKDLRARLQEIINNPHTYAANELRDIIGDTFECNCSSHTEAIAQFAIDKAGL